MDTTDEVPARWWILNAHSHKGHVPVTCSRCPTPLNHNEAIAMVFTKPMCASCATSEIGKAGTPMTVEYMKWVEQADPRWWSPWLCQCKGCHV